MPELAEVEIIKRQLETAIPIGSIVQSSYPTGLRFSPLVPKILTTPIVSSFRRRGKFILLRLRNATNNLEQELVLHLGMTGQLRVLPLVLGETPKHTHFQLQFTLPTGEGVMLLFIDARKFGKVSLVKPNTYNGLLAALGPEVYEESHPVGVVLKSRKPIKALLLDQRYIAGIGNYLADEILFDAKVKPTRLGKDLSLDDAVQLVKSARHVAEQALRSGGLSFSDYTQLDGSRGDFQNELQVYGRSGQLCKRCPTPLTTISVAGRTTVFCGGCQT